MTQRDDLIEKMPEDAARHRHDRGRVAARWPELMDLPNRWGEPRHNRELGLRDIKGNCGQLYDVFDALALCNEIINDPDYSEYRL